MQYGPHLFNFVYFLGSSLGTEIKAVIDQGKLVSDELVLR